MHDALNQENSILIFGILNLNTPVIMNSLFLIRLHPISL
jgi:hypothetical protein